MSCTYDGRNDFERWSEHCSQKGRTCAACRERISKGQRYVAFVSLCEGYFATTIYCQRCKALIDHLVAESRDFDEGPDPYLDCGHDYEEVHGRPPPDHIAALAFWLPGDPIPEAAE